MINKLGSDEGRALKSIKGNIIANYFGAAWSALMGLLFVPTYIRYLGIEAYGLVGIFAMLQGWLSLMDMGMTPALSREMALRGNSPDNAQSIRNLLRSVEIIAGCMGVAGAICLALTSKWLVSHWLRTETLSASAASQAFVVMGIVIGLRFVENIYRSSMIGLQRQVFLNIVASLLATLRGVGAIAVLAFIAPSTTAFFLWQGVVSLLTMLVLSAVVYRVLPKSPRPASFSIAALERIWRFALGATAITVLTLLLTQVDKLLLSRLLTLKTYGYYTFAAAVAAMPSMVVGPVTQAYFPRFAKLVSQDDQPHLISAYHTAAQLVTVLLGSGSLLLLFYGKDILRIWTRDANLAGNTYMLAAVLCSGNLINGLVTIPYYLQMASGWTGLTIRFSVVAIAAVVPALFWVVPIYGAKGAACVWVCMNAAYMAVSIQFMHKRLLRGEKWRWCFEDVGVPLVAGASTAWFVHFLAPASKGSLGSAMVIILSAMLVLISISIAAPKIRQQIVIYLPMITKIWSRHT